MSEKLHIWKYILYIVTMVKVSPSKLWQKGCQTGIFWFACSKLLNIKRFLYAAEPVVLLFTQLHWNYCPILPKVCRGVKPLLLSEIRFSIWWKKSKYYYSSKDGVWDRTIITTWTYMIHIDVNANRGSSKNCMHL